MKHLFKSAIDLLVSLKVTLTLLIVISATLLTISALSGDSAALIVSDGKMYFSWLRSLVMDGDLFFQNDYKIIFPPDPLPPSTFAEMENGRVPIAYPPGLAFYEAPGFLLAHLIGSFYYSAPLGIEPIYQFFTVGYLVISYALGVLFLSRALHLLKTPPLVANLCVFMAVFATNLIHYVAKEPAMSHGAGFTLIAIATYLCIRINQSASQTNAHLLWLGIVVGLSILIRNTNALLAPFYVCLLGFDKNLWRRLVTYALPPALATVSLQPLLFSYLSGELLLQGYGSQGKFTSDLSGMFNVLFSAKKGLIFFHPAYGIAILFAVLLLFNNSHRRLAVGICLSTLLFITANGLWHMWWFGDSFGHRAFIELIPPLTIASAVTLQHQHRTQGQSRMARIPLPALMTAGALLLYNGYLWLGYLSHSYPHVGPRYYSQALLWFNTP